mmetsp:Transcript_6319/g.9787  ORF Transcript_6319/g.9787 Transcript_6319/m.9787 type:complete len:94 (+) Transcript_6319:46-327(+)
MRHPANKGNGQRTSKGHGPRLLPYDSAKAGGGHSEDVTEGDKAATTPVPRDGGSGAFRAVMDRSRPLADHQKWESEKGALGRVAGTERAIATG